MTIENLKKFGADTELGLTRCMGNEGLYFKLVQMIIDDGKFAALGEALGGKDLEKAFDYAHALKGTLGNLALDPLYEAISEIVEPLRRKDETYDYLGQYEKIEGLHRKLGEMAAL